MKNYLQKQEALRALNVHQVEGSGSYLISCILWNQRVKRIYTGYSKTEAVALFKQFIYSI
jgi:ammonia channel protein AmtB